MRNRGEKVKLVCFVFNRMSLISLVRVHLERGTFSTASFFLIWLEQVH